MCDLNKKTKIKVVICELCLSKECDKFMVWCKECYKNEARKRYKKYYELNKDNINSKKREQVTCECGCVINKGSLSGHKKTQTHNQYLINK